jgi:Flp pilus assembly protein TadB
VGVELPTASEGADHHDACMSSTRSRRMRVAFTAAAVVGPLAVNVVTAGWNASLLIPLAFVLPVALWAERRARRIEADRDRN